MPGCFAKNVQRHCWHGSVDPASEFQFTASRSAFPRQANEFVNNLQEELTKLAPVISQKIKEALSVLGGEATSTSK